MHLQIQANVRPINVPVYELPEFIYVETKWITREYANKNNMENLPEIPMTTDEELNHLSTEYFTSQERHGQVAHCGTMTTDQTVPMCNRHSQTEISAKEIGVQCNMDEEEIQFSFKEIEVNPEEAIIQEAKFLTYVSDNTSMFPNGMLECLRCGEIALTLQEHQNHMSKHYGPTTLCHMCGKQLEHHSLLTHHFYSCAKRPLKKPTMRLKCPFLLCNYVASTQLRLTVHMRLHRCIKYYRCSKCRRIFKTTVGYLMHRKNVVACHKGKPLRVSRTHAQSTRLCDLTRCTICLSEFSNVRRCVSHTRNCIRKHHLRLEELLGKQSFSLENI